MCDLSAAEHDELGSDPLIAVQGRRGGFQAVMRVDASSIDDLSARTAYVQGRAWLTIAQTSEELRFDGDGKGLIAQHRFGILRVNHRAAVSGRPRAGMGRRLLA